MILKRLETYVLTRTMRSVAGALAVISSLIILISFVELSRTLGDRGVSAGQTFGLALLQAPVIILQVLPFVFLFGVLSAFVALNRRSELIAMRAAGVSAWRFILPAATASALIGVVVVTAVNPLATTLNKRFELTRAELAKETTPADQEVWLSQGDDRGQVVFHARSRNELGTQLNGVVVRMYGRDARGGLNFLRRVDAATARLTENAWVLSDVRVGVPGAPALRMTRMSIPTVMDPSTVLERFASPMTVPFWRLPQTIDRTEASGLSPLRYELRLHQLLASPLLYAAMSILAAGFSLRLMRLGGLAGLAAAGVTLGFVFFFLNELCGALGAAELLPPYAAAWAPPVLAFLAGLTLLAFTEDG